MKRIGIVGGRGHVGRELLSLLEKHPQFEVGWMTSSTQVGEAVSETIESAPAHLRFEEATPDLLATKPVDAIVLALPNGQSESWVRAASSALCVLDLSTDHRFDEAWTYGYAIRNKMALRGARRIANPGCYATAIQAALEPIAAELRGPAHTFGVSGYSGAGTAPTPKNDPDILRDNLLPYSLVNHAHEREVTHQLKRQVFFAPHVAPFFRGLTITASVSFEGRTLHDKLVERYSRFYERDRLTRIATDVPLVRDAVGRHEVNVGGFSVSEDGMHAVIVSTLDNLLGGAATHALRNLNLAMGFDEYEGLIP